MNRTNGSSTVLRNTTSQANANRNTTTSSRLVSSKPGAWSNTQSTAAALQQSHENVTSNSWSQALNPRAQTHLDLSSSAFPSLVGGSSQSHTPSSSQWQSGPPPQPPQPPQPQQNIRSIQQRTPQPAPNQNFEQSFNSFEQSSMRSQIPPTRAPPGLLPTDSNGILSETAPSRQSPTTNGDRTSQPHSSPHLSSQPPFNTTSPIHQDNTPDSIFNNLSEKDKWGLAGWSALYSNPSHEYATLTRAADLASFASHQSRANGMPNSPTSSHPNRTPLLQTYTGPFAPPTAPLPKPLTTDYHIPDCYHIKTEAFPPLTSRISGFTEDTLFYIFYTSPRDIIQEEVASELMARKWRYHIKERSWLTRDEAASNTRVIEKDVSEEGMYIWWDVVNWKKVRRGGVLRYEDLDDQSGGGSVRLTTPGPVPGITGAGVSGNMQPGNLPSGMTGLSGNGTQLSQAQQQMAGTNGGAGGFNAVPGLERMAMAGRF